METASTISARNSLASAGRSFLSSWRKSAGVVILSSNGVVEVMEFFPVLQSALEDVVSQILHQVDAARVKNPQV